MKKLPNDSGVLWEDPQDYYGRNAFSRTLLGSFPDAPIELNDEQGLIHCQMEVLARMARTALDEGNSSLLERIYRALEFALSQPRHDLEIDNAILTSFLTREDLDRFGVRKGFWEQMPDRLKAIMKKMA